MFIETSRYLLSQKYTSIWYATKYHYQIGESNVGLNANSGPMAPGQ